MKTSDLRQKNTAELAKMLSETREKMASLQFDLAGGKVKNIKEIRTAKLDAARIMTLLGELESSKGDPGAK